MHETLAVVGFESIFRKDGGSKELGHQVKGKRLRFDSGACNAKTFNTRRHGVSIALKVGDQIHYCHATFFPIVNFISIRSESLLLLQILYSVSSRIDLTLLYFVQHSAFSIQLSALPASLVPSASGVEGGNSVVRVRFLPSCHFDWQSKVYIE